MSELYIGLMSGTSIDAIDAVLVEFSGSFPNLIQSHSLSISSDLKEKIKNLCQPGKNEIERLGRLDHELGIVFSQAVTQLLNLTKTSASQITAIGSHGQTVRHQPNVKHPFTLQIGDANIIAEQTGITTIADFRRRDMAAGGQGAPLVPAFHDKVFRSNLKNRLILNIGGMANITILPKNPEQPVLGFDTGPGNVLLDTWIYAQQQKPFDENGQWASSGTINSALLAQLLTAPYFACPPPKSTGREYFNWHWINTQLDKTQLVRIAPEDVQNTLMELTAYSIAQDIHRYAANTEEIYVCGGGAHNSKLIARIKHKLLDFGKTIPIHSTIEIGVNPDWVEAIAFAWLAKQTLEKQSGNLMEVTGARRPAILGGVYFA